MFSLCVVVVGVGGCFADEPPSSAEKKRIGVKEKEKKKSECVCECACAGLRACVCVCVKFRRERERGGETDCPLKSE